jgi:hypothetical protein
MERIKEYDGEENFEQAYNFYYYAAKDRLNVIIF